MSAWRISILSRGGLTVTQLDELEDHLELVEADLLAGMPADEAFWVAAHRVGTPDALTREFGKVTPNLGWAIRAQWALLGLLAYWLLQPLAFALVYALSGVLVRLPLVAGFGEFMRISVQPIALLLICVGLALVVRRAGAEPWISEKWLRPLGALGWRGLLLVAIAVAVLHQGTQYLAFVVIQWAAVPAVPGQLALIQGDYWYWLSRALGYAMPAAVLVLAALIQRRVDSGRPTS